MDILSLRHVFTAAEIEDSELGTKVRGAEKKLAARLDSAAKNLADYAISRNDLGALVASRIRENVPILRKALFPE